MYVRPPIAPSSPYGLPSCPWAISTSQAPMTTRTSTTPVSAVAWTSICAQRSSRPGPPRPASVSERRAPNRNAAPRSSSTAAEVAPSPALPPIAKAAKISAARSTQKPGMNQRVRYRRLMRSRRPSVVVDMEDLLYVRAEVAREREGEGQRGRVALFLDRVDGLARDVHRLPELLLREATLRAEVPDTVVHAGGWKANLTSRVCQAYFPSSPCSRAPLTLASSALSRYSASASGDPKRRPGAASGP